MAFSRIFRQIEELFGTDSRQPDEFSFAIGNELHFLFRCVTGTVFSLQPLPPWYGFSAHEGQQTGAVQVVRRLKSGDFQDGGHDVTQFCHMSGIPAYGKRESGGRHNEQRYVSAAFISIGFPP